MRNVFKFIGNKKGFLQIIGAIAAALAKQAAVAVAKNAMKASKGQKADAKIDPIGLIGGMMGMTGADAAKIKEGGGGEIDRSGLGMDPAGPETLEALGQPQGPSIADDIQAPAYGPPPRSIPPQASSIPDSMSQKIPTAFQRQGIPQPQSNTGQGQLAGQGQLPGQAQGQPPPPLQPGLSKNPFVRFGQAAGYGAIGKPIPGQTVEGKPVGWETYAGKMIPELMRTKMGLSTSGQEESRQGRMAAMEQLSGTRKETAVKKKGKEDFENKLKLAKLAISGGEDTFLVVDKLAKMFPDEDPLEIYNELVESKIKFDQF